MPTIVSIKGVGKVTDAITVGAVADSAAPGNDTLRRPDSAKKNW